VTALIVLCKDQSGHLSEIDRRVKEMPDVPDHVIIVADRPKIVEWNRIKSISTNSGFVPIRVTNTPDTISRPDLSGKYDPFLAGYCRNIGIDAAIERGATSFVFIDGDCMPEKNFLKTHISLLDKPGPVATIGRRVEAKLGFRDQREVSPKTAMFKWFGPEPKRILSEKSIQASGVVWSCNLGMNLDAINAVKELNRHVYGRAEVFSSQFSGRWGGEDGFLGDGYELAVDIAGIVDDVVPAGVAGGFSYT
jgi:hypothetical protein